MKKLYREVIGALLATLLASTQLAAQVQTEVPPIVPGAKPVSTERIKIHGTALEGNLEGDATSTGRPRRVGEPFKRQ